MERQPNSTTLPRFISPTQLAELTGLSGPTLWRLRVRGDLPPPVRLSPNRVAWPEPVIADFLQKRAAQPPRGERRAKPVARKSRRRRGKSTR